MDRFDPMVRTLLATAAWAAALTIVATVTLYATSGGLTSIRTPLGLAGVLSSRISLVVPFVTLAGGLALAGLDDRRGALKTVLVGAAVWSTIALGVGAFLTPWLDFRLAVSEDPAVERYPLGPETPITLARHRTLAAERPPAEFDFSDPIGQPPNWLGYRVLQPFAFALFGILNGPLGLFAGWWTSGLSPPRRRRRRWSAGLLNATGFFVVNVLASGWVREAPSHSGVAAACAPVALWVLATCWLGGRARPASDSEHRAARKGTA